MPESDVIITMSAREGQLFAMWKRQDKEIENLRKKLGDLNKTAKRGNDDMLSGLNKYALRWITIDQGINTANRALSAYLSTNQRFIGETQRLGVEMDKVTRKFLVQSNLSGMHAPDAQRRLGQVATKYAMPKEFVGQLATSMVSGGFEPGEVLQGGALEGMAEVAQSMGPVDQQAQDDLSEGVQMFMKANKMAMDRQNVRMVGKAFSNLYQKTLLRPEDYEQLAAEASSMAQSGFDWQQQLAMFSIGRDVMPGPEAATGQRNMIQRLRTVGAHPEKVKALRRVGLTKDDVNFSEGDTPEAHAAVFNRLREALAKVAPVVADEVLNKVFEEKGQNFAKHFLANFEQVPERMAFQADEKSYLQRIDTATGGTAAQETRLTQMEEQAQLRQGYGTGAIPTGKAYRVAQMGIERSPARIGLEQGAYSGLTGMGVSPETSVKLSEGVFPALIQLLTGGIVPGMASRGTQVNAAGVTAQANIAAQGANSQKMERLSEEGNSLLKEIRDALIPGAANPWARRPAQNPPGLQSASTPNG